MVEGVGMDTQGLKAWAEEHGDGAVDDRPDRGLSLTSKLLRFRWNGAPTVGAGFKAGNSAVGKTRINAVLDGLAWFLSAAEPAEDTLHIVLCTENHDSKIKEHLDAIGTVASEIGDGPRVRLWTLNGDKTPVEVEVVPAVFTSTTPKDWAKLLDRAASTAVEGLAEDLVAAITDPCFALYPKLSSQDATQPWQMRLDGLDIGRVGAATGALELKSKDLDKPREPRATWKEVVGSAPFNFNASSLAASVELIEQLITAWRKDAKPGAVLHHGQAEHALEAFVLSGRLQLVCSAGELHAATPHEDRVLRAAQFPTLWGNVTAPRRSLDALLADSDNRPWAIELKDQEAGGGHGAYLRHGIGQAILYRHYIRSVEELDPWFKRYGLERSKCEAAVAFPTAKQAAEANVDRHRDLARRCGVEIIEFPRPGSLA